MNEDFFPVNSETLVVIGAGATAALGMPTTEKQTEIFRNLSEAKSDEEIKKCLSEYFIKQDLAKVLAFLKLLDCDDFFEIRHSDIQNAKVIYGQKSEELLRKRILELRSEYDWNAAKRVLKLCPHNEKSDNLIRDAYSIIDQKILARQSIKVQLENGEEVIPESRLKGARNFLTLFINMLFSAKWYRIAIGEKAEEFEKYKSFVNSLDRMMRNEGHRFYKKHTSESRGFYLWTTSFVSFNFEMVFPWLFMNLHRHLNKKDTTYIGNRPMQLWLDFGCEHRGRKTKDGEIVPTLEFTESVASRQNEADHAGNELHRCGKFYFAHGSSNWRECPVCGRMTFYNGDSKTKWECKSKQFIAPFPIPLFENNKIAAFTPKEIQWRKELQYDALQCMHCGSKTLALDAPMIMQTLHKSTPTSFLEEIQRNVKVAIQKARHIVILGYSFPIDDTVWQQAFAEGVRSREKGREAYCSVVVGLGGERRWLYGNELTKFINGNRNTALKSAASAIENALAIFEPDKVRAWTGGIPQVFGNCAERDVKGLLYPDFVIWGGTRLE